MANNGRESFNQRLRVIASRVWPVGCIMFVIGVVIGLVPWILATPTFITDRAWWAWNGWTGVGALAQAAAATGAIIAAIVVIDQLRAMQDQLRLAREAFQFDRKAARPELEPTYAVWNEDDPSVTVRIGYVHGSEPAYDVRFLLRRYINGNVQSVGRRCGILAPTQPVFEDTLSNLAEDLDWPCGEPNVRLADVDYWLGMTWLRSDGTRILVERTGEKGHAIGRHTLSRLGAPDSSSVVPDAPMLGSAQSARNQPEL